MKAGRSSYDCGDVSVTTARLARSKNCYKNAVAIRTAPVRRLVFAIRTRVRRFHGISL